MADILPKDRLVNTDDIARLCSVTRQQAQRWANEGP